jgi:hypothetical protein
MQRCDAALRISTSILIAEKTRFECSGSHDLLRISTIKKRTSRAADP